MSLRRITACFVLAVSLDASIARAQAAPTAPAPSEKNETAKAAEVHFQRARQLYDEGDFSLALVEFKRAYEVSPSYRVLYNIAQVNIQLFNYAAARLALEQFMKDGGPDVSEARRGQAEADLKMLSGRTAYLQVLATPAGAEVSIDDQPPTRAPFEAPLLVNAGQRKIVVSHAGYTSTTRLVTLAGGDRSDVKVDLVLLPVATITTTEERPRSSYTPAIIGWTATGIFTVSAAVVGALYLGKQSDIDDARNPTQPITADERDNLQSSAKKLAIAADVLGLAAIGCAAAAIYFTIRPPHAEKPATAGLRLMPQGVGGVF